MTELNLFDNTELTVLGELEREVQLLYDEAETNGYYYAIQDVLAIIEKLKPTEIDKLKLAFAEGGAIPQSAESWVRKFRQNCP